MNLTGERTENGMTGREETRLIEVLKAFGLSSDIILLIIKYVRG